MTSEVRNKTLINKKDLKESVKLKGFIGSILAAIAMPVLSLNKINKFYDKCYHNDFQIFLDNTFKYNNNSIKFLKTDLNNIPDKVPIVFIANHPLGGWDGLALIKILSKKRPDVKFVVNFLLEKIAPLKQYFIGVNPFEKNKALFSSYKGIREMHSYLQNGNSLAFFPAGEVSTNYGKLKRVEDRAWQNNIIKFIKQSNVYVVPVYINDKNSPFFHFLGRIHPSLRTLRLPQELINKKNSDIKIRFGYPIHINAFKNITKIKQLGKTLKSITYCLNTNVEESSEFSKDHIAQHIIETIPANLLIGEINEISKEHKLFSAENYSCFFAPTNKIPNIFKEISRLRELTFRTIGEGTGQEFDNDKFDKYYNHLFIWDDEKNCIVGAYRIGMGKEIIDNYGINGFYLNTLFNFKKEFETYLSNSMELGRSFIVQDYQRKTLPLFLLWRGINNVTMMYPDYKYLIGPVSISSLFSTNSKILLLEFLKRNYNDPKISKLISPRLEFKYKLNHHHKIILDSVGNDINKMDKIIKCIDINKFNIPILIKKYMSLGGIITEFNVDPDFNFSIDGLVILDINKVSEEVKKSYS